MKLSVIIPTYNRANLIEITLQSLIDQDFDSTEFEILVVDNNSGDNTAEIIRTWSEKTNGLIQYHSEKRQGSHFARNGIINKAKGDILYFTDDDMIADKSMLTALVSVLDQYPEVGTVTGRVLPKWEINPPAWVKKYCTNGWLSLYDSKDDFNISEDDFGVFSCHQAVRKELFVKAGGYNPDIVNGEWLGDNETGLNIKLKSLGAKFAFTGAAITFHMIPPGRMTQSYLNKRFGNQGFCDCYTDFRANHFSNEALISWNKKFKSDQRKHLLKYWACVLTFKDKWHIHKAYQHYYEKRIEYNKKLMHDKAWREMVLINDWINL